MRVLADEQFNELNEHIKQLEAENKYLKKLLDDAGIPYGKTDNAPDNNETNVISIKEESITKEALLHTPVLLHLLTNLQLFPR